MFRCLIVVLAVGCVSLPPLSLLPAQQAKTPVAGRTFRDLRYVSNGHDRHRLDLYLPAKGTAPYPVVVFVHGGAWFLGSKDSVKGEALFLLEHGYAIAAINYRLSQHALFPAQIVDCKAAVRWLRANAKEYQLDANRFAAMGSSAGGHLAAMLGTTGGVKDFDKGDNLEQSSRVQAVVDWYGPTDFLQMGGWHNDAGSPESKLIGGPIQEHKEKAANANPITYVAKDNPPFLIMHGDKDSTVPFNQSELLAEALKKASVEVNLVPMRGAKHGGPQFKSDEAKTMVAEFLAKHLK
ncbi:MAG: alpha/beta hydrolase fold domain-containing protein [Gemmataceae bacterium]